MSFGDDEEILQDFLVEAGEILEQLSEQLVDLERRPDDHALLNAIFRGFHTVKGGAGFLQLDAMVECCHVTENLFDILRTGKRSVTPELMDVVLQALDTINGQFRQVSKRQTLQRASPALLAQLERLVSGETLESSEAPFADAPESAGPQATTSRDVSGAAGVLDITDDEFEAFLDAIDSESEASTSTRPPTTAAPADSNASSKAGDTISEDEFEGLLDKLHGKGKGPGAGHERAAVVSASADIRKTAVDEINEEEFEALLDQLHGKGKGPGVAATAQMHTTPASPKTDLITDDEFENLLDQLHGKGKGPSVPAPAKVSANAPQPEVPESRSMARAQKPGTAAADKTPGVEAVREFSREIDAPAAPSVQAKESANASQSSGNQQTDNTVRVDTQRLDDIMNMVGELVLVRNRLVRLGLESVDEPLSKAVANLDVVTADLQSAVMKTRMQPIRKVFGRFPRVVRDLARNLKKEISLDLIGEDTDLDKNLVDALADPLVHLVRNSVDHGIELPDVRAAAGKSRTGRVVLAAEQEGDHILLSISDDGAGMDPVKLRDIAVKKGLYDAETAARLSDVEAFNLIFAPGFSTRQEISDVSGRGVGMDVVKTKISQLNGSIEIISKKGEGTRILIKVPLTLAIMPTLMVMLGTQCFALPLASVNEIFQMDLSRAHVVDGQECVTIREKAVPIFHLKRWLVKRGGAADFSPLAHVVIVSVGTRRVGFVVDQLIGQEEVVIKPLGKMLHGTPGMAGATITGDGTIALILDVPSLLKRYAGRGHG